MKADLVVFVLAHELNPENSGNKIDKEHNQRKLHQRILVSIEVTIAVRECHLTLDKQVDLLCIELLLV